jgi:hypothetical protein
MLLVSIALILGLSAYLVNQAMTAVRPNEVVQASVLCCLCLLAALEHIFLAIPFRDSALWNWALETKNNKKIV